MAMRVEIVSVRDSDGRGLLTDDDGSGGKTDLFMNLDDVQRRVPKLLRGLSSYWQVRVFQVNGHVNTHVYTGWRAGPNGTGERWAWAEV